MSKITDLERWRVEIQLAENFRDEHFGKFTNDEHTGVGENIEFYENGFSNRISQLTADEFLTTVNIIDAIVSIIVPSVYYKNPRTIVTPKRIESEESAPLVGKVIDHYRNETDAKAVNQKVIWDSYVLGLGVSKTGYATKFGKDIADKEKEKERKSLIDRGLERIGLKKKPKEDVVRPDIDLRIIAENPFIQYVSPFNFLKDPRSTSLNDAMWCGHSVRQTVKSLKSNRKYKNTELIKGMLPEVSTLGMNNVTESEIEAFKTVDLYEIHYRNDDEFYILVISKDGSDVWREHYHEKTIYRLGEWQFDELWMKRNSHVAYPKSDITKIKNLQDRITSTIDSILEQVDKFVPKLAYLEDGITPEGKNALMHGDVGALVSTRDDPAKVFRELNFTQLKTDLQALIDQLISLISVQTGLTRAQLTGLSDANTATEATIEQGGQNIRISDMQDSARAFINRQSNKLWKIIRQFVDLEELNLINGVKGIDENTGLPKYNWLTITPEQALEMETGDYDFDIEVGSTQKTSLAVVRKAFENLFNILARSEVIALMQQQGDKVELAEMLKKYFDLFPEIGVDSGKIIQKITRETTGLIPPQQPGPGGMTRGSANNQLESQMAEQVPSMPQELSEVSQI